MPLHEQQLRQFILERSYDAIPYRKFVQAFDRKFDKLTYPKRPHASPLMFLSDIGREDLMQEVLEYHPGMSNEWSGGDSPLWYAVRKERKDHLRIFFAAEASRIGQQLAARRLWGIGKVLAFIR